MKRTTSRVLLTGATGFLGSHLLSGLLAKGFEVAILKRSSSSTARIADRLADVRVYEVDTTPLRTIFEQGRFDAVIHAATAYGRKGERIADVIATNVVFGMQLLETAAEFGVPAFLNSGTFSVKGGELPEGLEYYVLTKRHFSEYGARFAAGTGIAFVDLQLEHVYGPGDDGAKFVPMLVKALVEQRPKLALTAGGQHRDFIYVDDVVAAYLRVLERLPLDRAPFSRLEVGSGEAVALADFVRLAREVAGSSTELDFGALPYRAGELMHSAADGAALRSLGWAPTVTLRDGLARTIAAARAATSGGRLS